MINDQLHRQLVREYLEEVDDVLADFDAALIEARRVEDSVESIRIAAEEAEAYAKRSKAKNASDRENAGAADRGW